MFSFEELSVTNPLYNKVQLYGALYTLVKPSASRATVKPCFLPIHYKKFAEQFHELEVYEDDVWVLSFARTGTTWTQEMVWMIGNDLDYVQAKNINLTERFPFLEFCMFDAKFEMMMNTIEIVKHMSRPRFIKSHLPAALLPKQLWTRKPRIIYVTRNPKDVAISYYHHLSGTDFRGSMEDFFELFMADLIPYGPFINHTLDFWKLRNEKNISIHTYEEMKQDLPTIIRQTATFLGKSLNDEEILTLSEHLSFKSMKENNAVNLKEEYETMSKLMNLSSSFPFIRNGESGAFRRIMSTELIDKFDKWTTEQLKNTDFKFRF